jgi:hypothetical protein
VRELNLKTERKTQLLDITGLVQDALASTNGANAALVYVPHTTAGVTINEDADPALAADSARGRPSRLVITSWFSTCGGAWLEIDVEVEGVGECMFVVLVLVLGVEAGVEAGVDGGRSRRRREYRIQQRDPATAPSRRGGRLGHRFIRVCLPHLRRRPKPRIAT